MAEKSATVAATIAVCPTSPLGLAGVLEHRHDEPQRRRRQRDRQQQRAAHPARRRASQSPIANTEGEGDQIAEQRDPQQPPAQPMHVDLQPGQEQQEGQPDQARICTGRSTCTQPSTDGPSTMPATISRTTDGIRSRGAKPSASGAAARDQADDEQVEE